MTALIDRRDLNQLPGRPFDASGYVYAIEFGDGTIKVGVTISPRLRAQALHDFAGRHGIGMLGVYVRQVVGRRGKHDAERDALARIAATPAWGREWFQGLTMADAKRAIDGACTEPTPAEQG